MKRFPVLVAAALLINLFFSWSTAHACPYPSVAWYFDSIPSHGSYEFPLDLEPCEEVFIIVITDTSPSLGAALKLRIHNSLGDEIASEIWSAYGSGVTTTLDDLGMRGDECHPAYGVFESLVWDVYSFLIIVINIPRPGYNVGGGSFDEAYPVALLPAFYRGSLCDDEPGQFFKVSLAREQEIYVFGYAEGSSHVGAVYRIDLYDASQQHITTLAMEAAYGKVTYDDSFTNPEPDPADFYLKVWSDVWDVYDFQMILSGTPRDTDGDGIPDRIDNCPLYSNRDQADGDSDEVGDVCDNCPVHPNPGQEDEDDDGMGDLCDPYPNDTDNDGVDNGADNCPTTPNPDQTDGDGDDVGDVCDNCPADSNPEQEDGDDDSMGDVCDPYPNDTDNDGVDNGADNCPTTPNPDQADGDGDGVGDLCDNCPLAPNPDQFDYDGDGIGIVCDDDLDNDGVPNDIDNCPMVYNPDQVDTDGDEIGDECDMSPNCADRDEDGYGAPAGPDCDFPLQDCDDTNPEVNPGTEEICDNGIDDDCDGLADGADVDCVTEFTLELDASFAAGTLTLDYTVGTPEPAGWANYLILIYPSVQFVALWTAPLPAIHPPIDFPVSFPFPSIGWVGFYTALFTEAVVQASDLAWVNTGGSSP